MFIYSDKITCSWISLNIHDSPGFYLTTTQNMNTTQNVCKIFAYDIIKTSPWSMKTQHYGWVKENFYKSKLFTVWGSQIEPYYLYERAQFRFPILYIT